MFASMIYNMALTNFGLFDMPIYYREPKQTQPWTSRHSSGTRQRRRRQLERRTRGGGK